MKLVIQRVTHASVEVEGEITGQIEDGLMVLVGFGQNDSEKEADYLARKLAKLRIFHDDEERMNLSVKDIGGKLLLVPQFTLVEVETGIFGAFMKVDLLNNGPVTIILEKEYDEEN